MKLITAVHLYRNRFQKPALFFSVQNFSVGSIIFVPFTKPACRTGKSSRLTNQIAKPALIIQIDNLEEKKFFIRKNKLQISKIRNPLELQLFKKEIIKTVQLASQKINLNVDEILQKLISKKIIRELNQLTPTKIDGHPMSVNFQKFVKNLSPEFIKNKLKKYLVNTKNESKRHQGLQTINSILAQSKTKKTSLYSEKHYLADEIRDYFGETAKKGVGSFGFYLGFFGKIPKAIVYQYWSEVKQSNKSLKDQQKIFWWKVGQYLKTKSGK